MRAHSKIIGFTLIEMLVVISIIAILGSMVAPAISNATKRGGMIRGLNNVKQIHLASITMSTDRVTLNDPNIGWPGDYGATQSLGDFAQKLVDGGYLHGDDLKVFSAGNIPLYSGTTPSAEMVGGSYTAFYATMASIDDPDQTVFLYSRNWDPGSIVSATTITTGSMVSATAPPFGTYGFIIMHKGGDAMMLNSKQSGDGAIIGSAPKNALLINQ